MREENNKNRRMHTMLRHNKYLDFEVYGSPSVQYITQDSLVNVLEFNAYHALTEYRPEVVQKIKQSVAQVVEAVPIFEKSSTRQVPAVKASDVPELIKSIEAPDVMKLSERAIDIERVAVADEQRTIPSLYTQKKLKQNPELIKSSKDKLKYVKAVNKISHEGDKVIIQCSCCHTAIDIESAGCHRAHDIPRADGGDWSQENVYLTCATCNATMSDQLSVLEYKVELYAKITTDSSLTDPVA